MKVIIDQMFDKTNLMVFVKFVKFTSLEKEHPMVSLSIALGYNQLMCPQCTYIMLIILYTQAWLRNNTFMGKVEMPSGSELRYKARKRLIKIRYL